MTVSVGSYHDLEPEPKPLERSPSVPCYDCGSKYDHNDYWIPRYVEGKSWDPATVVFLCDECLDRIEAEYEQHKIEQNHRQLTEFNE